MDGSSRELPTMNGPTAGQLGRGDNNSPRKQFVTKYYIYYIYYIYSRTWDRFFEWSERWNMARKHEIGGSCGTHEGKEKCISSFGVETGSKNDWKIRT